MVSANGKTTRMKRGVYVIRGGTLKQKILLPSKSRSTMYQEVESRQSRYKMFVHQLFSYHSGALSLSCPLPSHGALSTTMMNQRPTTPWQQQS